MRTSIFLLTLCVASSALADPVDTNAATTSTPPNQETGKTPRPWQVPPPLLREVDIRFYYGRDDIKASLYKNYTDNISSTAIPTFLSVFQDIGQLNNNERIVSLVAHPEYFAQADRKKFFYSKEELDFVVWRSFALAQRVIPAFISSPETRKDWVTTIAATDKRVFFCADKEDFSLIGYFPLVMRLSEYDPHLPKKFVVAIHPKGKGQTEQQQLLALPSDKLQQKAVAYLERLFGFALQDGMQVKKIGDVLEGQGEVRSPADLQKITGTHHIDFKISANLLYLEQSFYSDVTLNSGNFFYENSPMSRDFIDYDFWKPEP